MYYYIEYEQKPSVLFIDVLSGETEMLFSIEDILNAHNLDNLKIIKSLFFQIDNCGRKKLLLIVLLDDGNIVFFMLPLYRVDVAHSKLIKIWDVNKSKLGFIATDATLDIKNGELLLINNKCILSTNIYNMLCSNKKNYELTFNPMTFDSYVTFILCINGKKFVVLDEDFLNLYQIDSNGNKTQLSKNINCHNISFDGSRLYLLDNNGDIYYRNFKKNNTIIDSAFEKAIIRGIIKINQICSVTYFLHQNGKLFVSGKFKIPLRLYYWENKTKYIEILEYAHRYPRYTGLRKFKNFSVSLSYVDGFHNLLLTDFENKLSPTLLSKMRNIIVKVEIKNNFFDDQINLLDTRLKLHPQIKSVNSIINT